MSSSCWSRTGNGCWMVLQRSFLQDLDLFKCAVWNKIIWISSSKPMVLSKINSNLLLIFILWMHRINPATNFSLPSTGCRSPCCPFWDKGLGENAWRYFASTEGFLCFPISILRVNYSIQYTEDIANITSIKNMSNFNTQRYSSLNYLKHMKLPALLASLL